MKPIQPMRDPAERAANLAASIENTFSDTPTFSAATLKLNQQAIANARDLPEPASAPETHDSVAGKSHIDLLVHCPKCAGEGCLGCGGEGRVTRQAHHAYTAFGNAEPSITMVRSPYQPVGSTEFDDPGWVESFIQHGPSTPETMREVTRYVAALREKLSELQGSHERAVVAEEQCARMKPVAEAAAGYTRHVFSLIALQRLKAAVRRYRNG